MYKRAILGILSVIFLIGLTFMCNRLAEQALADDFDAGWIFWGSLSCILKVISIAAITYYVIIPVLFPQLTVNTRLYDIHQNQEIVRRIIFAKYRRPMYQPVGYYLTLRKLRNAAREKKAGLAIYDGGGFWLFK